jgi:DNA-binding NarL/FixJ family response regulator
VQRDSHELSPSRPAILVVDDHQAVADVVVAALRAEGFDRVRQVGPGGCDLDGIVTAAAEFLPDIVLVDLYLAGDAGAGLAAIRALAYRGVTVLVFTASDDPRDTALCLEAGAMTVAHKAEPFDTLLESVEKAAYGRFVDVQRNGPGSVLEADRRTRDDRLRRFESLTSAEAKVLRGLVAGASPQEIAAAHSVTIRTIRTHIESIHRKLDVRSQLAAVALARDLNWPAE